MQTGAAAMIEIMKSRGTLADETVLVTCTPTAYSALVVVPMIPTVPAAHQQSRQQSYAFERLIFSIDGAASNSCGSFCGTVLGTAAASDLS